MSAQYAPAETQQNFPVAITTPGSAYKNTLVLPFVGPIAVAIIDGTGVSDDAKYAAGMANSFCHQIFLSLGQGSSKYWRGPTALGNEVEVEANVAAEYLIDKYESDPCTRLFLSGYSRGASAAVFAAEILNDSRIPVDSLFLFDAVARHRFHRGQVVPANVQYSYHAMRTDDLGFIWKYEGSIDGVFPYDGLGNPTRPSFGHTALNCKVHETFQGTHGALGGVGWKHVTEDVACQEAIATWMNGNLKARGINVKLASFSPDGEDSSSRIWSYLKSLGH